MILGATLARSQVASRSERLQTDPRRPRPPTTFLKFFTIDEHPVFAAKCVDTCHRVLGRRRLSVGGVVFLVCFHSVPRNTYQHRSSRAATALGLV